MSAAVLFAGSGTGGHLYPGLAVAEVLARECALEPHFLCGDRPVELHILEHGGFPRHPLPAPRALGVHLRALRRLLAELRPAAVVGLGGGASVPAAMLAALGGRPLFLLEQNRVLGRANRWLLRAARRVFLSYPDTRGPRLLRHRAVATGCPVRAGFRPEPIPGDGPPAVLVLGGSLGAAAINDLVVATLPALSGLRGKVRFVHLRGHGKGTSLTDAYREHGFPDTCVHEYLDDPAQALREASLVIARSGGSTCAELAAVGRAALLLPYPHHRDRQQFHNAAALVDAGAASVLDGDPGQLADRLRELAADRLRLAAMGQAARALAPEPAAPIIAHAIATHLECAPRGSGIAGWPGAPLALLT